MSLAKTAGGSLLRAGFGRRDITPPLGTLLMGYPVPARRADAIRDRLAASALVLERYGQLAANLSLDVTIVDDPEVEAIRRGLAERSDIAANNITVCATQTHSGPNSLEVWGWGEKDEPFLEQMVGGAIEAALDAADSLEPVVVGIGETESEVGVNRREIRESHEITLGVNPWAPYDPVMTVLRFEGENAPVATLIHYGAHPTVLGSASRVVSRDWPGIMVDRIETLTEAPALFINGAVGDVAPRVNNLSAVGDGEEALLEVGSRAATDALRAYHSIKSFQDHPLSVLNGELELPYRPLPSLEEARRALEEAETHKDELGLEMATYRHWQCVVETLAASPASGCTYSQVITGLGPIAFVPFPGEPFAEIILRLRHYSPWQHTLCASTSCGSFGYFATRESLHRGGYEVWVARAFGPYILTEEIDDILVEANLALLRELHERPSDLATL